MPMNLILFDFSTDTRAHSWRVVDDGVMGGLSQGSFSIDKQGHGVFSGEVSLENNGGFSSIRHRFKTKNIEGYSKVNIRLKGDGKKYQFRLKSDRYDAHSYVIQFQTSGAWETITLSLDDMVPQWRGRRLRMPNFQAKQVEEMAFLIGNKKRESFQLILDSIVLE